MGSSMGHRESASGHTHKENNFPSLSSYQLPKALQVWMGLRSLSFHCKFSFMYMNINMNIPKISSCKYSANFLAISSETTQIISASCHL